MSRSNIISVSAFLALLITIVVGLAIPAVRELLLHTVGQVLAVVEKLGPWGPVILALVYIVASVAGFPGLPISLGAGFLFGPYRGTAAASIGSTLGAAAAFLVGRTLARHLVEARVAKDARFRAIDHAVARQGFRIVLLIRLAPVFPFNVMNYAFGLTKVRFRDYFFASWIGMFPATAFNVYIGSLLGSLAEVHSPGSQSHRLHQVFFYAGLAATLAVVIYVTRMAKAALTQAVPDAIPTDTDAENGMKSPSQM